MPLRTTVLLVNLGTVKAPTYWATRQFLQEFLSDQRVVTISKWLWYPILYSFILPFRSYSSAKKYQRIVFKGEMPLIRNTMSLYHKLKPIIEGSYSNTKLTVAMRYGNNNIKSILDQYRSIAHHRLIVLPLFPQYSATTTASIFDEVARCLTYWKFLPNYTFIRDYCNHPAYINALCASIQEHWAQYGKSDQLLLSYHGLPEINHIEGDPYACYCHKTTRLVAQALKLPYGSYQTVFQSRFGPSKWLQPYAEATIINLAQAGLNSIDIISPSFAVDCLETVDEIAHEYAALFQEHGGRCLRYISALNAKDTAVSVMTQIITAHLS